MRFLRRLLLFGLLLALLAGGAIAAGWWWLDHWLHTPNPLTAEAVVTIPKGSGLAAIADKLAEAGAVEDPRLLRLGARIAGKDRRLQAGEYAIEPGMTPLDILDRLERGQVMLHAVTVPEGLTVYEVYGLLAGSDVLSGELPPAPPEGTLLPDTYMVPRDQDRAALVAQMRQDMTAYLDQLWAKRPPDLPLKSPAELLTLASIIEKETSISAEYPLVAAVFVNRLKKGIKLQTDPTVIYALSDGKGPLGRELLRKDLEVQHAYNTYVIDGLPPGPIANPGRGALAAAIAPADVDYLYFVADGTGGHTFAKTLNEHNRNVTKWRQIKKQAAD
ncbi:MAG: endolytic transglycosylase MltG [Geminicoccaceae bacterium]